MQHVLYMLDTHVCQYIVMALYTDISSQYQQWTALQVASDNSHHETVQLLLERGADPQGVDQVRVVYI